MRDEDLKDLSEFLGELQGESDRGLALVGASLVDEKLLRTLESFFCECKSTDRLLNHGNSPLGTFSSRADACLSLGLIDEFEHREINLIRKVRNEFAHGTHGTTFQNEKITNYCSSLESDLPEGAGHPTTSPRFRYTNAIISLVSRLYYRPEWVEKERRVAKTWVEAHQVKWRSVQDELPPEGVPVLAITKRSPTDKS